MTDKSLSNHSRHWRTIKCTTIYACFFPALTNLRLAVPFPPPPSPKVKRRRWKVSISLPTGYGKWLWKIYDISSNASDRSPFFSRRSRSLYLLCRSLKLSQKTRCTILMYLGQEDCPPSTFGLFANHATKLLNLSCLFLAAILLTEKRVALSSRLQRNYLFKKYLKNLEILRQMIQL